jgi:hypothetical protein
MMQDMMVIEKIMSGARIAALNDTRIFRVLKAP